MDRIVQAYDLCSMFEHVDQAHFIAQTLLDNEAYEVPDPVVVQELRQALKSALELLDK